MRKTRGDLARRLDPELFRALGDPVRLTLLVRLATSPEPLTVSELSTCCGTHLSGVSRHLATLREAGIVQCERVGREARYTADWSRLTGALRGLMEALEACRASCCGEYR